MSQQNKPTEALDLRNGKVTNNDRISKRSVAAIFPSQAAADAVVGKLMETDFVNVLRPARSCTPCRWHFFELN